MRLFKSKNERQFDEKSNLVKSGDTFYDSGNFEVALEYYNKVLALDPQDSGNWRNKGSCLCNLGRYKEAIEPYNIASVINPQNPEIWYEKSLCLSKLSCFDEALECSNKALTLNPQYQEAWNNNGVIFSKLGRSQEALDCCNKTLESNPINQQAWNNKLVFLEGLGRLDEALECCDKALKVMPNERSILVHQKFIVDRKNKEGNVAVLELLCDFKEYSSKQWHFTVKHPASWKKVYENKSLGQWTVAVCVCGEHVIGGFPSFMVSISNQDLLQWDANRLVRNHQRLSDGSIMIMPHTPTEYIESYKQTLALEYKGSRVISSEEIQLANYPAVKVAFTHYGEEGQVQKEVITLFYKETVQLISQAPVANFGVFKPVFAKIIDSFILEENL